MADNGCRIRIIQDTREQVPIKFGRYKYALETKIEMLNAGDYACDLIFPYKKNEIVVRSKIIYERKSKGDLWGTFGGTRERYETFKHEFNRSKDDGNELIVIVECEPEDIMKGYTFFCKDKGLVRHPVQGSSLMRKLETIRERYGLCFVYKHGRNNMKRYMYERWYAECKEKKRLYKG